MTELLSKQIDTRGMDGEDLQIAMPSEAEVSNLVSASKEKYKIRMGKTAFPSRLRLTHCYELPTNYYLLISFSIFLTRFLW